MILLIDIAWPNHREITIRDTGPPGQRLKCNDNCDWWQHAAGCTVLEVSSATSRGQHHYFNKESCLGAYNSVQNQIRD